ncbi:MAG: ABC transporter permease subunit [Anaerolineales bacterium]
MNTARDNLLAAALLLAVILLWEGFVRWRAIPIYILPAPGKILATLAQHLGMYLQAAALTLFESLAGLVLGAVFGFGVAALLGLQPRLERGVMTLAILLKSTPMVAIAPLLTIWLGFGIAPKIIITALLTFFPVLVNALSGFNALPPALLETFHIWNANRREIFWHARLPTALPYLFAALRVSAPLSLIGAVVAEWTGASGGLGRVMWLAYTNLNLPFLFAAVFLLAALGIGLYQLVNWLEHRLIFWV